MIHCRFHRYCQRCMSSFLFFLLKDLCCAGVHHQELATVPTPQLLSAASLTCSAVILRRPASCKSGKTSGNYVSAAMIQSTLWKQNKQEQTGGMTREVTSILREGGSAVMSACLACRSLGTQVLEDTGNFSRPVTKPMLKACMVFIHPPASPVWVAGWPWAGGRSGV